jgi:hypothetical protein
MGNAAPAGDDERRVGLATVRWARGRTAHHASWRSGVPERASQDLIRAPLQHFPAQSGERTV